MTGGRRHDVEGGATGPRAGLIERFRSFLARYPQGGALFFSKRVSRVIGAFVAAAVFPTPVTPNAVTIAGFVAHLLAAIVVVVADGVVSVPAWILVIVLWQVAFGLDCADGQLARARRATTAFGAWLDAFVDVATHVLVYSVLALYLVRSLSLDATGAVVLTASVIGGHLLQLATSWGHSVMGTAPAVPDPPRWLAALMQARQVLDYGWFLFAAALLLPFPVALLVFVSLSALAHVLAALTQLSLNWYAHLRTGHGDVASD